MTCLYLRHPGPVPGSTVSRNRSPRDALHGRPRNRSGVTVGMLMGLLIASPAAAQTQAQMKAQAGAAYKAADAAMTREWQAVYAAMKKRDFADTSRGGGFGYAAATLASQRAWLAFRDKQCAIEGAEFAGGSLQPMAQAQCLARLTRERTAQLRGLRWTR